MGGGYKRITGDMGNTFSSENQPANRGRPSVKLLTDLVTKNLKKKQEITIKGIAIHDCKQGDQVTIRVLMPNKETIVQALLRQAAKGNVNAINVVFDRVEGKPEQSIDISSMGKSVNTAPVLQIMPTKVVNAPELEENPNLFADE